MEGAWTGPFPLDRVRACEMRLKGDGSLAIECGGTAVVGGGRYRWDGSRLEVELSALAYDGRKVAKPGPIAFKVQGAGNVLKAAYGGEVYEWKRTMR